MARNSIISGWQVLFTPGLFLPFILGAVALGVLGNAVFQILTNTFGADSFSLLAVAASAILLIAFSGVIVNKVLYQWRPGLPLAGKIPPEKRKGLILLVSSEKVCRKAIEYHQDILSYCWLICSARSMSTAERLQAEYANESTVFDIRLVTDEEVYDPTIFKEKVEKIYDNLPEHFTESDVILDFTGMTGIASVGAVLACLKENRSIQYVPAVYNAALSAQKPLDPIEVELDWRSESNN